MICIKKVGGDIYIADLNEDHQVITLTTDLLRAKSWMEWNNAQVWLEEHEDAGFGMSKGEFTTWECDERFGDKDFYIALRNVIISYSPGNEAEIKTKGCDCCSRSVPLTPRSLDNVIQEAADFLNKLQALREKM